MIQKTSVADPSRYAVSHPLLVNCSNSPGKKKSIMECWWHRLKRGPSQKRNLWITRLPVLLEASLLVLHVLQQTTVQLDRRCSWIARSRPQHPASNITWSKNCVTLDSAQDWVCQRCFFHRIAGRFFSFLLLCEVSGTCALPKRKPGKQLWGSETCLDSYILDSLTTHPQRNGFKWRCVRLFFQKTAWREIIAKEITHNSPKRMNHPSTKV